MKDFHYWKQLHDSEQLDKLCSDNLSVLWLKVKSVIRKETLAEFVQTCNIQLKETSLNKQFLELYNLFASRPSESLNRLDSYMRDKNRRDIASLDIPQMVSELYKLRTFDWGGDYQNSLDKYLVSHYVKTVQSYDNLISKFETEINPAVQAYVLNSWYNHWSSILIEHIFKSHPAVLPTVGKIKYVDFFIGNLPFDLKVTYLPAEYIKTKRKEFGLPVELTFLKQKAKELHIQFDNKAKPSGIYYEIVEKMKDRADHESQQVIETLKKDTLNVLKKAQDNPKFLAKWLYENQGEMRFGAENRLFLVLVDIEDFSSSWKLKRNMDLLKPVIGRYLNQFHQKDIRDLKITFRYKYKPQEFTAFTDVIFVVK